ncbi:MAG: helix-turn-helix domain-containing protein [Eubacteriales bacterium]|nr:helix-turn-helix domain-containing protein [Eubacteriales bacterium]
MEMTLGKRLAAERRKLGITQDKLAEQLGVTAQAVSKWENDLSCSDVTMLPRLAEIFGTTTDALLGMEPVHQAEVVSTGEAEEEGFHYQDDRVEIRYDGGRRGTLGIALWVLLTGAVLLASVLLPRLAPQMTVLPLSLWSAAWPAGLLVFGLMGLYPKLSFFRLGCALFGGYTLAGYFLGRFFNRDVLLPFILVVLGLSLLADALRKPKKPRFSVRGGGRMDRSQFTTQGQGFTCSTCFGEDTRRIDLARLMSGDASVSFGELTVDLTDCGQIGPNARVNLSCSFGELCVLVPRTCQVEYTDSSSFGGVEVKGRPNDDARDHLTLECNVSFGSIEVRYV